MDTSASDSNTTDAFADSAADSLLSLVKGATTGDAQEAQNILLRRIALEGDVVPSRVPAPLNITQIGGYLNLLATLNETAMRSQVLAGILGVAGPANAAGWTTPRPPFSFEVIANDRPAGPLQASLPVTIAVRSDLARPLAASLKTLHDQGCQLPLLATPAGLPTSRLDPLAAVDPLPYVGRVLQLAWPLALRDPGSDPIVLVRASSSTGPYRIALNSTGSAATPITPIEGDALKGAGTGTQVVALSGAKLVDLDPLMAAAGFYPRQPLPEPASSTDSAWSCYTSVAGLVPGVSRLGDELASLYNWTEIAGSIFSTMTGYVWNGTAFAP